MTFNVFDNALFGDAEQFDIKVQISVGLSETVVLSDSVSRGLFVSQKLVFNSRIKPIEDVSI